MIDKLGTVLAFVAGTWLVLAPVAVILSLVLAAAGVDFARDLWGFDG